MHQDVSELEGRVRRRDEIIRQMAKDSALAGDHLRVGLGILRSRAAVEKAKECKQGPKNGPCESCVAWMEIERNLTSAADLLAATNRADSAQADGSHG